MLVKKNIIEENDMLNIYIYVEDESFKKRIERCVQNYKTIYGYDMDLITSTSKYQQLIKEIQPIGLDYNVIIIDVSSLEETCLKKIRLTLEIRRKYPTAKIICLVDCLENIFQILYYGIEPLGVLEKTRHKSFENTIKYYLDVSYDRYVHQRSIKSQEFLRIDDGEFIRFFDMEDIVYFNKLNNNKIKLVHKSGTVIFKDSLKKIEEYSRNFIRCHPSLVINRKHIKKIDKKNGLVIMSNGEECWVSRRKMKLVCRII